MLRIKAVALALALSSVVGLGGCATTTDPTNTTAPDYSAIVAAVQAACATACKFVPTAGTIISIVTAGNPGVVTGVAIASAICAALQAAPAAARKGGTVAGVNVDGWRVSASMRGAKAVPMVNGVPIQGQFIN